MQTISHLKELAKTAALSLIEDDVPLNESIAKIAREEKLGEEHIDRVCQWANHLVNAHGFTKEGYTHFELASPTALRDKLAFSPESHLLDDFFSFRLEEEPAVEKTASVASDLNLDTFWQDFQDLASYYHLSVEPAYGARSFVKQASKLLDAALEHIEGQYIKVASDEDQLYREVKQALYEGVSYEQIKQDLSKMGFDLKGSGFQNRLEAEGLIRAHVRDDAGPHSLQRIYKKADFLGGEAYANLRLSPESPLAVQTQSAIDNAQEIKLAAYTADLCLAALVGLADIPGLEPTEDDLEKAASVVAVHDEAFDLVAEALSDKTAAFKPITNTLRRIGGMFTSKKPGGDPMKFPKMVGGGVRKGVEFLGNKLMGSGPNRGVGTALERGGYLYAALAPIAGAYNTLTTPRVAPM